MAFLLRIDPKAMRKIQYNLNKATFSSDIELFKKLNEDIWEFRTLYNKTQYRLFAFWDKTEKAMVVVTHGHIKKSKKTPKGELDRAEEIMKMYLSKKSN